MFQTHTSCACGLDNQQQRPHARTHSASMTMSTCALDVPTLCHIHTHTRARCLACKHANLCPYLACPHFTCIHTHALCRVLGVSTCKLLSILGTSLHVSTRMPVQGAWRVWRCQGHRSGHSQQRMAIRVCRRNDGREHPASVLPAVQLCVSSRDIHGELPADNRLIWKVLDRRVSLLPTPLAIFSFEACLPTASIHLHWLSPHLKRAHQPRPSASFLPPSGSLLKSYTAGLQ